MQIQLSLSRLLFTIAFLIPMVGVLLFEGCGGDPPMLPRGGSDSASGSHEAPLTESHGGHLDIHPGSCPNPLNTKARGVLPVAVLGSSNFDVHEINASTLQLLGVEPIRSSFDDVATPVANNEDCECTTQGADGFEDLVLHFRIQEVVTALGPISSFNDVRLTLTGNLMDGTPFGVSDCMKIVGTHELPEVRFATTIRNVTTPYNPAVPDTVGMFRPFAISYHGISSHGKIRAYRFFSLTPGVQLEDENVWSTNLSDTIRIFPNVDPQALPSGIFRLAVQCRDNTGAVSLVDASTFRHGVCQVVVNFEPETDLFHVLNTYEVGGKQFVDSINFSDEVPDTVPYQSWVTLFYRGWDRPSIYGLLDSSLCLDVVNKCIRYQVAFTSRSDQIPGFSFTSRWLPEGGEDNNPFGTPDTTSMNMGTVEYGLRVRSMDEYGKPDGSPVEIPVVSNFKPTLDDFWIENYDGTVVKDGGTVLWDWWSPANFHGSPLDTLDISDPFDVRVVREFYFLIKGSGHDHPKEASSGGVKSWFYLFRRSDDPSFIQPFARSGLWADVPSVNTLCDTVKLTVTYSLANDLGGMEAWEALPDWLKRSYDFTIEGRDTRSLEIFDQYMFVNGAKTLINQYNAGVLGRRTEQGAMGFHLDIVR